MCEQASESRLGAVNVRADDIVGMSRAEALAQFSSEQQAHILSMANNPSILRDLGRSVAPGVFGHESVKRAVLLMLLGGVHKTTAEVRWAFWWFRPEHCHAMHLH